MTDRLPTWRDDGYGTPPKTWVGRFLDWLVRR